jgi:hypothetical protein
MDSLVKGNNLMNHAHIVAEAIYQSCIVIEEGGEGRHVMDVPSGLKRVW